MNIAVAITWLRLPLTLASVGCIILGHWYMALAWWLLALGTDVLDGYLARRLNLVTPWGAVLDATIDKIATLLLAIVLKVPAWFLGIFIIKEGMQGVLLMRALLTQQFLQPIALGPGKLTMVLMATYLTYLISSHAGILSQSEWVIAVLQFLIVAGLVITLRTYMLAWRTSR